MISPTLIDLPTLNEPPGIASARKRSHTARARAAMPFYGPADPPREQPRLLLVSWHFPPGGATGALRWQKLASHASRRGWGLDVLTLDPGDMDAPEWARLEELPRDTRIWSVPKRSPRIERTLELIGRIAAPFRDRRSGNGVRNSIAGDANPARRYLLRHEVTDMPVDLGSAARGLRAWREFHDWRPWAYDAAAMGLGIIDGSLHRAVVTCGPPHVAHVAGAAISRETGLPLIVDMRDPWSLTPIVSANKASRTFFRLAAKAEREVVRQADLVVLNTDPLRIAMQGAYPEAAARMMTVMNGCDEERPRGDPASRTFTVAYAGSIYIDRDPRPLFEAVSRVVCALELSPDDLRVEFMGAVDRFDDKSVADLAESAGIADYLTLHATRPRAEALDLLARSQVLVSFDQSVELAVPSKIFEYMQFESWLLVFARRGSATEILLRGSGADVLESDNVEGIARRLRARYEQFARGERPTALADSAAFHRALEADRLFDAIQRVTLPKS